MKQVCLLCERVSPDSNLYCQETYCPAEMSPNILDYGEWLGDIEIVKAVMTLRSAVVYEAYHQKKQVFLKVAHPGEENKERLKREAEFLKHIQLQKEQHEFLPVLLPPYTYTKIETDAYGKAMLKGHLLYFYMFEHAPGEPLRDVLMKNPQLWINHVGWLMISLGTAVNFLHTNGLYHLGISPDSVLVHFEDDPNVPRILLFDLGAITDTQNFALHWHPFFVPPAYTAPELIDTPTTRPGYATDVYGLGLTLYELLVGEPAYTFKLHSDDEVYRAVRQSRLNPMNRVEDVRQVAQIAIQAVSPHIGQRQENAAVFVEQLRQFIGEMPGPKKSRWPSLKTIFIIIAAMLAIAFIIVLAVSLRELAA